MMNECASNDVVRSCAIILKAGYYLHQSVKSAYDEKIEYFCKGSM